MKKRPHASKLRFTFALINGLFRKITWRLKSLFCLYWRFTIKEWLLRPIRYILVIHLSSAQLSCITTSTRPISHALSRWYQQSKQTYPVRGNLEVQIERKAVVQLVDRFHPPASPQTPFSFSPAMTGTNWGRGRVERMLKSSHERQLISMVSVEIVCFVVECWYHSHDFSQKMMPPISPKMISTTRGAWCMLWGCCMLWGWCMLWEGVVFAVGGGGVCCGGGGSSSNVGISVHRKVEVLGVWDEKRK